MSAWTYIYRKVGLGALITIVNVGVVLHVP